MSGININALSKSFPRKVISVLVILSLIFPGLAVSRAYHANILVKEVLVNRVGLGVIRFDVTELAGLAACAGSSAYKDAVLVDVNTKGGALMTSLALTAKTSGQRVNVYGTGTCALDPGIAEDADYIHIISAP